MSLPSDQSWCAGRSRSTRNEAIHPPVSGRVDQSLAHKAIRDSGTVGDILCCWHIDRKHHYILVEMQV